MLLAADIGGTNCRMALFEHGPGGLSLLRAVTLPTTEVANADALFVAFERELGLSAAQAEAVAVALAGPVADNCRARLSNGALALDFSAQIASGAPFYLLNDFTAQAHAIFALPARHLAGPKTAGASATRAVLGAGTGLGQAMLLRTEDGKWLIAPSENGHTEFPFLNEREYAFHDFLRRKLNVGYASRDDTLTGRGLALLHEFLTGETLAPWQVGQKYLSHECETLAWYSRFYGRACRDYMLSSLCLGGMWIAGGIAAQNPLCVSGAHFFAELYNSPAWAEFLRAIPLYLMEDRASGLWGAAACAAAKLGL